MRFSAQEEVRNRSVAHSGSFKPPSGKGRTWSLQLVNSAGPDEWAQEVRLGFAGDGGLPEGHSRYALDLSTERRMAPGQTVKLAAGERRLSKRSTKAFGMTCSDLGFFGTLKVRDFNP